MNTRSQKLKEEIEEMWWTQGKFEKRALRGKGNGGRSKA